MPIPKIETILKPSFKSLPIKEIKNPIIIRQAIKFISKEANVPLIVDWLSIFNFYKQKYFEYLEELQSLGWEELYLSRFNY